MEQYPIDPLLVQATQWQESRGDSDAVSPKGAVGDMQTMPGTLTDPGYGVQPAKNNSPEELHRVGVDYLQAMHNKYKDPNLALVAYNYGPKNTDQWLNKGADPKQLPAETQNYVKNINSKYQQLAQNTVTQAPKNIDSTEKNLSNTSDDPDIQLMLDHTAQEAAATQPKPTTQEKEEDPDIQLMLDHVDDDAKAAAAANSTPREAGPEWLQDIGKATDALGASMTPLKMAAIVPSLGLAPALSGVASAAEGIPYIGAAANALAGTAPEGAGILATGANRLIGGAAQGAAVNTMMGGDPTSGAIAGGALNTVAVPALNGAGKLVGMGYNAITGGGSQISPELAGLAKTAADKYGISIPGGLLSDNPIVKDTYSTLKRLGAVPDDDNVANFTSAASKTFGENTHKLTRGTMDNAESRIGGMFDDVWKATPNIKISDTTLNKLTSINGDAEAVLPNDSRIPRQINNILDAASQNGGSIPSALAKNLVSTQSQLHKLTRLGTDPAADLAFDIKNTLYDALGESAPPEVLDKYNQAKSFYKNYKTVEAAKPNPVTGELSPTSLANAVNKTSNKFGSNNLTDLQNLGDIGQQFKLTPSSGTAEKLIAAKLGVAAGSGVRYNSQEGLHYDPEGAAMTGAALFGGSMLGKYLSSGGYRNRLINSALANKGSSMMDLLTHNPGISTALVAGHQAITP